MDIKRTPGSAAGRSRIVEHNGLVYTVATAREKSPSMKAQTADALARLDENLAAAGSGKARILTATVYIADMAKKAEMNEACSPGSITPTRRSARAWAWRSRARTWSRSSSSRPRTPKAADLSGFPKPC
jgi:enamine deaminase RidA (YjgF/YER057c/UK114 family)